MACGATADAHCCWVPAVGVCRFFDPTRVADGQGCNLRTELGSWDAVYADDRYPFDPAVTKCGEWPGAGRTCASCGVTFDG